MLTVDISLPDVEELHRLVQDGQEKGFLTYDEIVNGLEEVDLSKEQVEDFYTYLIDHSIELVEGEQHKHPPHEQIAIELEMTTDEVREILRMAQVPVSLEKPIGEEEESELGDFVQDDQAESPFDTASLSLRREDIDKALESLPERERKVIELRFGLKGEQPCTLEEVGRAFGVTRERIRQIENNTLKKLESLPEAQGLKDCV